MRPDRRYQVFISSTFNDLAEERKAAVEAVFERGHIPIALERFSPADASDLEIIKRAMSESQVYILILGHRYGQTVPGRNMSFTEFEYTLAQEYGLLTLVFVMDKNQIAERRRNLDPEKTVERLEISNFDRLMDFQERVSCHFRRYFRPGPDFKYVVELALADNLSNWEHPGFIREPSDRNVLEGAKNEFIGDLVSELTSFGKLYERTQQYAEKKRGLSKYFVQHYMDRLLDNRVSLFFESGSTVAFLAKEMSKALYRAVVITENGAPSIQISTNNVLAYLLLWLKARIPCTKFPWSPPVETTYGAAYGGLENLMQQDPDYRLPPLDESARREIQRLEGAAFTLSSMKRPILLLGAASGLQLDIHHRLKFREDTPQSRRDELAAQLGSCFGPHVGSYHNKVFKRFMYATKLPLMFFLTADKIDSEIEVGKCHFILDSEFTWDEFYRSHPVAFCVGCNIEERVRCVGRFRELEFEIVEENSTCGVTSFVARNHAFIREFESVLGMHV